MAYTINKTDGTLLTTIADGTINTSATPLALPGRNFAGYGQYVDTDLVHMLENFADTVPPPNALKGQLWFDTNTEVVRLCPTDRETDPAKWLVLALAGANTTTTFGNIIVIGNTTGNTANFNVINNLEYMISPNATITVLTTEYANITNLYTGDIYTPNGVANGTLHNSWTVSNNLTVNNNLTVLGPNIYANTSNLYVSNISVGGNTSLWANGDISTSGNISAFNITAANLITSNVVTANTFNGVLGNFTTLNVTGSGNIGANLGVTDTVTANRFVGVTFDGGTFNGTFNGAFSGNITCPGGAGADTQVLFNDGGQMASRSTFTFTKSTNTMGITNIQATGAIVAPYVTTTVALTSTNITTGGAGTGGSITGTWVLTGGSTLQATYADLAERYEADAEYDVGTVLEISGEKEVTAVQDELSENVFGVVSSSYAYLLNAGAGDDKTHPPVAMLGRVPVKVMGKVLKGDRLVSAGNGMARAAGSEEVNSKNTIGRALEDKTTEDAGKVLAAVKINL